MPSGLSIESMLDKMHQDTSLLIEQKQIENPLMIGIHSGGVWIAERLHQMLNLEEPLGSLDISFYRDDFTQIGLNPKVQSSSLPHSTEGRHILLVDDVIMSGRTVRAAMNELFDYGRPASISLITLLDLKRRELPIQPEICGAVISLSYGQSVKLLGPDPLQLEIR